MTVSEILPSKNTADKPGGGGMSACFLRVWPVMWTQQQKDALKHNLAWLSNVFSYVYLTVAGASFFFQ